MAVSPPASRAPSAPLETSGAFATSVEGDSPSGLATGEEMLPVSVCDLLDETLAGLNRRNRAQLSMSEDSAERLIVVPLLGAANAIRGLIRNGLDASADDANVTVRASCDDESVTISVEDHGTACPTKFWIVWASHSLPPKSRAKGWGWGSTSPRTSFNAWGAS